MKKVLVLGSTGLIGSQIVRKLGSLEGVWFGIIRVSNSGKEFSSNLLDLLLDLSFTESDFLINAVGVTKHKLESSNVLEFAEAVWINSGLPYHLAHAASTTGTKVIHVTTDCVYSGSKGNYVESDQHDALDFYGRSKSLGEVSSPQVLNLRTSVIGPERASGRQFFDWLRFLPTGSVISGFENHNWSGVTADVLGDVITSLISAGDIPGGVRHLTPSNAVTKKELIELALSRLNRTDVTVRPSIAEVNVDRSLATTHPDFGNLAFRNLPSSHSRSIDEMVAGMMLDYEAPSEEIDEYRV